MILMFEMFSARGSPGIIFSRSLDVGFLTQTDWSGAVDAVEAIVGCCQSNKKISTPPHHDMDFMTHPTLTWIS